MEAVGICAQDSVSQLLRRLMLLSAGVSKTGMCESKTLPSFFIFNASTLTCIRASLAKKKKHQQKMLAYFLGGKIRNW